MVGAHLIYALIEKGEKVRATHRTSSDLNSVKEVFSFYTDHPETVFNQIEWVEADITELPSLTKAFENISHVYHCAAYISFNPKKYHALKKANVEGTANVVNLCLKYGIQKLCHVSSIATLGEAMDGKPITEENHWNPEEDHSVYSITKYGAEIEVWRASQEGLPVVIVNPGVILGEGYWYSGSGVIVNRIAKGLKYYTPGVTGFVDVRDVIHVMIRLMESSVEQERFILVAENQTFKDFTQQFAEKLQVKVPTKEVHRNVLMGLSFLDWLSSKLLGTKRKLLKATVRSMYKPTIFDSQKIQDRLGFEFMSLNETITRVATAYRKHHP